MRRPKRPRPCPTTPRLRRLKPRVLLPTRRHDSATWSRCRSPGGHCLSGCGPHCPIAPSRTIPNPHTVPKCKHAHRSDYPTGDEFDRPAPEPTDYRPAARRPRPGDDRYVARRRPRLRDRRRGAEAERHVRAVHDEGEPRRPDHAPPPPRSTASPTPMSPPSRISRSSPAGCSPDCAAATSPAST